MQSENVNDYGVDPTDDITQISLLLTNRTNPTKLFQSSISAKQTIDIISALQNPYHVVSLVRVLQTYKSYSLDITHAVATIQDIVTPIRTDHNPDADTQIDRVINTNMSVSAGVED